MRIRNLLFVVAVLVLGFGVPVFAVTTLFPGGGGTGTSTPPTYGQLLVGNSGGTYTLTATSSLGISGGGGTPGGASSTVQYNANGAFAGNLGLTYTGTNLGIGTTTPLSPLSIQALLGQSPLSIASSSGQNLFSIASTGVPTFNVPNPDEGGGFVVNFNEDATATPQIPHQDSIRIVGSDFNEPALYFNAWSTRGIINFYAAAGTEAAPLANTAGMELGRISARGYDGSIYTGSVSSISFQAANAFSSTSQGSWIGFRTTAIGGVGGGTETNPPVTAAITPSGGLLVGGNFFTGVVPNKNFYSVDPGNGGILASNLGLSTTSPFAVLAIAGGAGSTTPLFAISTSTAGFATSTALVIDGNGNLTLFGGTRLTTPKLTVSGITGSTQLLEADTSGNVLGTGINPSSLAKFAYPFPLLGLGTTSPLMILASTTIGNGLAAGGLTVSGGATTTGDDIFYPNGEARGGFVVDYNNPASTTPNVSHQDSITLIGDDNDFPAYYAYAYHFRTLFEGYAADGTLGAPTNTKSGAELVRLGGRGYGTTAYTGTAAAVSLFAAQDWTDTAQGAWVGFRTTPLGQAGGGSQAIPGLTAAFTASGGLIVGSSTAAGGSQFSYSPSNFAFYATDPGNGNILANGITIANATSTNATTTNLAILGLTSCSGASALMTNASGGLICGATSGGGSGTVSTSSSETSGYFPEWTSTNGTPALLSGTSRIFQNGTNVGIGTTTPLFPLNIAASGTGQLALTDTGAGPNLKNWLFTSQAGTLYIGTTTDAGATSTVASITILPASASTTGAIGLNATLSGRNGIASTFTQSLTGVGVTSAMAIGNNYIGAFGNLPIHGLDANATWLGTVNNVQASTAGGIVGASYQVNNSAVGLNVLRMSALNGICAENTTFASTTNCTEFNASAPSISTSNTITNFYGLQTPGTITGAGVITNYVGIDAQSITGGTNNTELLIGTATPALGNYGIYQFDTKNDYIAGNLGINTNTPTRANLEIQATTTTNASHALTIRNSSSADIFDVGGDGSTTASNGFNITAGCYAVNGTCLSTGGGGSGTVTSIATNNGITGGTITTTGTIGLAAIAANSVLGNITGGSAVPTALATSSLFLNASATNTGLLTSTDWSTFNGKLSTVTTDATLTGAGTGGSPLGLALTHANTWTGLEQFNGGASSTIAFSAPSLCISTDCRTAWPVAGGAASTTLLSDINTWTGLDKFNANASTTAFTASGNNFLSLNTFSYSLLGTTTPYIGIDSSVAATLEAVNTAGKISSVPSGLGSNEAILGIVGAGSGASGDTGVGVMGYVSDNVASQDSGVVGIEGKMVLGSNVTAATGDVSVLASVSGANALKGYGFESLGAPNYFQLNTGIGTSTPFALLSVAGSGGTTVLFAVATSSSQGNPNFVIDSVGHVITSGPKPAISGGTSTVVGNDNNGTITVTGTLLTSVTLTFVNAWGTAPDCTMSDNSTGITADITSISTTQVVFGFSTGINSGTVWYQCRGHQ